jgi:hypothetical protein
MTIGRGAAYRILDPSQLPLPEAEMDTDHSQGGNGGENEEP